MTPKQGVRNPPTQAEVNLALASFKENPVINSETEKILVKHFLEILHKKAPGNSVEVRIPPHAAVQVIAGTQHRRGTPPAVIETDPKTWLKLAMGEISWEKACTSGLIDASGERADLSSLLPLIDA